MKGWWLIAIGVMGGLLGAGLLALLSSKPQGAAIELLPPPTPAPLVVHVAGAVHRPGLVSLPHGARLQDALDAAGGLLPDADQQAINLAAFLFDGAQVLIPTLSPTPLPGAPAASIPANPPSLPTPDPKHPININTASQAELEALPGIGPTTARKIIDYRQAHGLFSAKEAIQEVPGIGPATFETIKDLITVTGLP